MEEADEFEDDSYGEGFAEDYDYEEPMTGEIDDVEEENKQ